MTTATVTPLRDGAAVMELHGFVTHHPSCWEAFACARRNHATPYLLPFPIRPELRPRVEVLAQVPMACHLAARIADSGIPLAPREGR